MGGVEDRRQAAEYADHPVPPDVSVSTFIRLIDLIIYIVFKPIVNT